jgi:hypothetical protein
VKNVNVPLRRSIAVAALALAPLLSSCGFDQPTDRVYNPGVGVNDRSGSVNVLNALVVSGADGSGTLVATFTNDKLTEADTLTDVSGAGASVTLEAPVDIAPGGNVSLTNETEVSVEGERVLPGSFITLRFTFENAETVELEMPVVARRGPYADIPVPSIAPTPHTDEEETSSSH